MVRTNICRWKIGLGKGEGNKMKKQLILENGEVLIGVGFGADQQMSGEVVFNTGMTGYQEILSDPSYCGQIVTLTYPLIGNYGINRDDFESISPAIHGLIVREVELAPSHWRNEESLDTLLRAKGIPGLSGIDTRKLTRMIREVGTLKGRICSMDVNVDEVVQELKDSAPLQDQVSRVSTKDPYHVPGKGKRVVLVDCGMKHGILLELIERGCDVVVVPYNTPAEEIIRLGADGVLVSNGPGNPQDVPETIQTVSDLLGKVPLFGICLGHQLLALATGATTSKLRFGHRGSNHPIREVSTGAIDITAQNHGYTVDHDSLEGTNLIITHIAVNDETVEGLAHKEYPAFSVQYHPEANPGPHDANHLFDQFMTLMNQTQTANVLA
jgi:carbamoyl-phosphate synthase small subunit